jgi:hypothetical protein
VVFASLVVIPQGSAVAVAFLVVIPEGDLLLLEAAQPWLPAPTPVKQP